MPGPSCRIRLYGHTHPDPAVFGKNLAVVLGLDEAKTRELLRDVPVVIQENLSEEKARALHEALQVIKALAIVEPQDAGASAIALKGVPGSVPFPEEAKPVEKERWDSRTWLVAGSGGLSALLLLATLVVYFTSGGPTADRFQPPSRQVKRSDFQRRPQPFADYSLDQLAGTLEKLELERNTLNLQLRVKSEALADMHRVAGATPEQLSEARSEVKRIRTELRRNQHERRVIRIRIHAIKNAPGSQPQP